MAICPTRRVSVLVALIIWDSLIPSDGRSNNNDHVNKRVKEWVKNRTTPSTPINLSGTTWKSGSMDMPSQQDNCTPSPQCVHRSDARYARIEKIKEDLLQKLGFRKAPNVSIDLPAITPHLQNLFDKWGLRTDAVQGDGTEYANYFDTQSVEAAQTERVYSFATQPPNTVELPEDHQTAYFRFSQSTSNNKVDNATLHFYINRPKIEVQESITNLKFVLSTIDDPNGRTTEVAHKSYKKNLQFSGHWAQMDVTKVVESWFDKPERNFGLKLEAMYKGVNLIEFPQSKETNGGKHTMYLEIITSVPRSKVKRDIPKLECDEKDNDTRCCRYPLVLDFESFGWDWVIAPKKYRANYCSGECPFKHLQRYLHTHLVQQVNPRGNVGPCCYPTQMSPILMVYFNENKEVLVSKVPGMIVTRCGCA